MQTIFQAVSSFGGQMMQRLLSVSGMVLLLSSSAFSDTATQAIPPDGEFYDHAAIVRCQQATEEYFGWEGQVEWEAAAALAFFNEYKNLQMITTRGIHPEGVVWGDCAINHDTDRIFVYDFAPGPYNPTLEPPELLTPLEDDFNEDL